MMNGLLFENEIQYNIMLNANKRKDGWMLLLLLERDIKKASLRHEVGLSAGTWTKLNKGEEVSLSILLRVCDYLNCDIGDICEAVRTDKN